VRKLIALIVAGAATACGESTVEQINFYVAFPPSDGAKIDQLATQVGTSTGMKVFHADRTALSGDRIIEIYDDDVSIDIASVPCDPEGNRPQIGFSPNAFFVSIASVRKDHAVSQTQLANLLQRRVIALGGRISRSTPACPNAY
jgi:hypothetical protein